jgi:hypothetical protein
VLIASAVTETQGFPFITSALLPVYNLPYTMTHASCSRWECVEPGDRLHYVWNICRGTATSNPSVIRG